MFICSRNQMREMDRRTIEEVGIAGVILMETAGRSAARILHRRVTEEFGGKLKTVAIFCGPGNNGGDGYVMARHLDSLGYDVDVLLMARPETVTGDAWTNLEIVRRLRPGLVLLRDTVPDLTMDALHELLPNYDIYVDALLGTGLVSDVRGDYIQVLRYMNERPGFKLAVDIPSGLDADTGWPLGLSFNADLTVTFGMGKSGLYLDPGRRYVGDVEVVDIGILPETADEVGIQGELLTAAALSEMAYPRPLHSHKGDFGHVGLIAGSWSMPGAASLATGAALSSGVGLTTVVTSESVRPLVGSRYPECLIQAFLPEDGTLDESAKEKLIAFMDKKTALAIGPGMGTEQLVADVLKCVLGEGRAPVVIDADGLNVLAQNLELLEHTLCPVILTPHPGEMARLTGVPVPRGMRDPISWAFSLCESTGAYVVLKFSTTVICAPDGRYAINSSGNPGMSTGGSGDVLTGLLAGLLASGVPMWDACRNAVFTHGSAGDIAAEEHGQAAMRAGYLVDNLSKASGFLR